MDEAGQRLFDSITKWLSIHNASLRNLTLTVLDLIERSPDFTGQEKKEARIARAALMRGREREHGADHNQDS